MVHLHMVRTRPMLLGALGPSEGGPLLASHLPEHSRLGFLRSSEKPRDHSGGGQISSKHFVWVGTKRTPKLRDGGWGGVGGRWVWGVGAILDPSESTGAKLELRRDAGKLGRTKNMYGG